MVAGENTVNPGINNVKPQLDSGDLRLRLAHDFVTPDKTVAVSVVCSHRRDVDDVVTGDETEHEEETDEELGPSGYGC